MVIFEELGNDERVRLLLKVLGDVCNYFNQEKEKILAEKALDMCYEWQKSKSVDPYDLYMLTDCLNEDGIFFAFEYAEGTDAEIWECYLLAVSYICKLAYINSKENYAPETIESVDEECYSTIKDICLGIERIPKDLFDKIEKQFMQ